MKRLFIVGCSRSGTTVLQKYLCQVSGLCSFPETAFFSDRLAGMRARLSAVVRLAQALAPPEPGRPMSGVQATTFSLTWWLKHGGVGPLMGALVGRPGAIESLMVGACDRFAQASGSVGWIEKTPMHCLEINLIRERIRPDGFIFVLRDPEANAASIRDRAIRFPEQFGGQHRIRKVANLWNSAIEAAAGQLGAPDVAFVSSEEFASDPAGVARELLARFMVPLLGEEGSRKTDQARLHIFAESKEPWKSNVESGVRPQPSKWNEVFQADHQEALRGMLSYDLYSKVLTAVRAGHAWGLVRPMDVIEAEAEAGNMSPQR